MSIRSMAIRLLAPFVVVCCQSVLAHHSQALFDSSQVILLKGKVARFDWVNPHMYLVIETKDPDGKTVLVEGEGLGITQALVDGLKRDDLKPGTPIVMRANPNRGGFGKQVRILDVTTEDGEIHPFYASSTKSRKLTPAQSIAGKWAPSRASMSAGFGAMARWAVTPAGREAQKKLIADGLCFVEPVPFLAVLDELRSITVNKDTVLLHFENTGDNVVRTVYLNQPHPANVKPTRHGHSTGKWEGNTLVIDTVAYEPNDSGIGANIPSSANKHTIERLALTEDRTRLRYEITVEDPLYLATPGTLTQQWDHRPDLDFSPDTEKCDPKVAARYKEGL